MSEDTTEQTPQRRLVDRWGGNEEVLAKGWVGVPTSFLEGVGAMKPKLTPAEALFLLNLMSFKWDSEAPFPSYRTLATRMGISVEYARKLGRELERKGYVSRTVRVAKTNQFDLQPLFDRLNKYVSKTAAKKAKAARAGRSKRA